MLDNKTLIEIGRKHFGLEDKTQLPSSILFERNYEIITSLLENPADIPYLNISPFSSDRAEIFIQKMCALDANSELIVKNFREGLINLNNKRKVSSKKYSEKSDSIVLDFLFYNNHIGSVKNVKGDNFLSIWVGNRGRTANLNFRIRGFSGRDSIMGCYSAKTGYDYIFNEFDEFMDYLRLNK